MNILQTIITIFFLCICFFGLVLTLTINSWVNHSADKDEPV